MKKRLSFLLVIGFVILVVVWFVFRNHDDVLGVVTAIISFLSVEVLCLTLYEQIDHNRLTALRERKTQIFEIANSIHFRQKGNDNLREYGFYDLDILYKSCCPVGCSIGREDYKYLLSVLDTLRTTLQEFLIINQISEISKEQFALNYSYAKGFADVIIRLYKRNVANTIAVKLTNIDTMSTETDEDNGQLKANTTEDIFPCSDNYKSLSECLKNSASQASKKWNFCTKRARGT